MAPKVTAIGRPVVHLAEGSSIEIGSGTTLISRAPNTPLGVARPVILRTMRPGARMVIGEHTGLSGATICASISVTIGNRVLMGADVLIADTDFHPVDTVPRRFEPESRAAAAPVVIGDDVFLGARSIVLKGVEIGAGTVVGAGAVVTSSLPPGVVAGGVPCRVLRPLAPASHDGRGRAAHGARAPRAPGPVAP
ncbi:acyltransferase [Streptomyces wuyuanensis]|uniref:acyltransferase n=1 Tax=Streptomyces wuyuanensis TaxID=1196353 RepID=UPI0037A2AB58